MTNEQLAIDPPKVISVTSGKGGVGKTNIALNLGLSLSLQGKKVLLLDADLGLANINVLLGLEPKSTIEQVLAGQSAIDDVIVHYRDDLDIIPASSGIQYLTHLTPEKCRQLIEAIETIGLLYDYILVDTGAGIGENVTFFNAAADQTIVVINHEPTSLTDAYALIKVLTQEHGQKHFCVIVNRNPLGNDGKKTFAKLAATTSRFLQVNLHYLGTLPEDSWVSESVLQQKPYLLLAPSSKISADTMRLAQSLGKTKLNNQPRGGLQFFFADVLARSMGQSVVGN